MAVGRISGPLLTANLQRNGINLNFKNTVSDLSLIHLDVTSGKIGLNKNTTTDELEVSGTSHVTNSIASTGAEIARFALTTNNINNNTGPIMLTAAEAIKLSGLSTDNIEIGDNIISSYRSNSNIDLVPNGTGTTEVLSGLEVFGTLNASGNISADGNITIGNDADDSLILNAEVTNNIIPDANDTYDLGSVNKRWDELHTNLVNTASVTVQSILSSTTDFGLRQGNIFYVSKNGNDSSVGDSVQGPLLTVKQALARADASVQGPVTIYIYPGTYEEIFPLTIPVNVSVIGLDMRNVIIKPTAGTNTNNCFLMNGETTVQHLTITDFYSPGNSFSFAPSTVVSSRSPYVQNVTVITKGSVVSASDPRGFAQGDAGKGALVDGASVNSASNDASLLFHSCTFITPGVDCITMTNGVRVEWLNSFTYFANRGLYAVNGVTGHLSSDGSTLKYGAELRSIGSANVYGNFGAVADGADCLMYLIQHNMAYIGSGKFLDNDPSRVIQSQETTEANSGKVYYTSQDHLGNFRVGDEFFVDLEKGTTSIVITEAQVDALNGLTITTNNQTTTLDGTQIDIGNFVIKGNEISTDVGSIILNSASTIEFLDNTDITGNLDMTGDLTIGGSVITLGNETSDTINFNTPFSQNILPDISGLYSLGTENKKWSKLWASEIQADDILIKDNFITTTESNADLDLRGKGTGRIYLPNNNFEITNALTVTTLTSLQNTGITGVVGHTNNKTQTGNQNITNLTITGNLDVSGNAKFDEILLDGNFITTTTGNNNLDLRANGTGKVNINDTVDVTNNFTVRDILSSSSITLPTSLTLENIQASSDIDIFDNVITTTNTNSDLEFQTNGTGAVRFENIVVNESILSTDTANLQFTSTTGYNINSTKSVQLPIGSTAQRKTELADLRFNSDTGLFEGTGTGNEVVQFGGIFSSDSETRVQIDEYSNNINFIINGALNPLDSSKLVTSITGQGVDIHKLTVDDIDIDSNTIQTNASNSNLELERNGSGKAVFGDIKISSNVILNDSNAGASFKNTGFSWVKFSGNSGLTIPSGDSSTRGTGNQIGDTRWNTATEFMEVYTGSTWVSAAGDNTSVTVDYMQEESRLWALLLG